MMQTIFTRSNIEIQHPAITLLKYSEALFRRRLLTVRNIENYNTVALIIEKSLCICFAGSLRGSMSAENRHKSLSKIDIHDRGFWMLNDLPLHFKT